MAAVRVRTSGGSWQKNGRDGASYPVQHQLRRRPGAVCTPVDTLAGPRDHEAPGFDAVPSLWRQSSSMALRPRRTAGLAPTIRDAQRRNATTPLANQAAQALVHACTATSRRRTLRASGYDSTVAPQLHVSQHALH